MTIHWCIKYANYLYTLRKVIGDVQNNVALLVADFLMFGHKNCE